VATTQQPLNGTDLLRQIRHELSLSQRGFAELLGCSARTIQSVEQGWRQPSSAMERLALLVFVCLRWGADITHFRCWELNHCSEKQQQRCPAYRYRVGHLCWLLSTATCVGRRVSSWQEKRDICLQCDILKGMLGLLERPEGEGLPPVRARAG
jgi:DNA-binding XRE family transcriptional regulator